MTERTEAVVIRAHGGPDVLERATIDLPPPGPGEAVVRHTAIAVNFSDINVRNGGFYLDQAPRWPITLGNEAAGVVEAVGPGTTLVRPGDRVVYAGTGGLFFENSGAYSVRRSLPAACLLRLPDDISDQQAAAVLMKGLTASVVIHRCFRPAAGDPVLIHAAASGVGSLLAQWCRHLGAEVIGTVGSAAKAAFAREHGCHHTILYREADFVPAVRRLAPDGVAAVLDGVGKDTFVRSFDCARPFAAMVNYGNASGPVPPINVVMLAQKGCLALFRPGYGFHTATRDTLERYSDELFALLRGQHLRAEIGATFPLHQAADAHRAIEAGRTTGSVLLLP